MAVKRKKIKKISDARKRARKAVGARSAEYPAAGPNVERSCGIGTAITS